MIVKNNKILKLLCLLGFSFSILSGESEDSGSNLEKYLTRQQDADIQDVGIQDAVKKEDDAPKLKIKNIFVRGNKNVGSAVILNRIAYKAGDIFQASKSADSINNLCDLGYFRQVTIEGENLPDSEINIYVTVEEKKLLEKVEFKGNKNLADKKLKEVINSDRISTIDEVSAQRMIKEIKKAYLEENRHKVNVSFELVPNKDNPDKVTLLLTIDEGPKSLVSRVHFIGNEKIPERKLCKRVFTRENWLLSFTDGAGSYSEDELEIDKHRVEYFYRDHGYLQAKVYKTKVDFSKGERDVSVTFYVKEGSQYLVRDIKAPGDEIYGQDELLPLINLEKGAPYSQTKVVDATNAMRELWGKKGYIYADVYPQIKPDEDKKVVDVTFHVERGHRMYVNKIEITGNKYTRDKVIRRQLSIEEGDLITSKKLNRSKNQVEYLGYFERGGIDWKVHRINEDLADLEMRVQEAKTGHFNASIGYGSDKLTPRPSVHGSLSIKKDNLFGEGYDIGAMIQASRHHVQQIEATYSDEHFLDSDVSLLAKPYFHWMEYDQWSGVTKSPVEKIGGFELQLGFPLAMVDKRLQLLVDVGYEHITNNHPKAIDPLFYPMVNRTFKFGDLGWVSLNLVKDTRNHKVYPNDGYRFWLGAKLAPPNTTFGFFKVEAEASWYYALIGRDDLVLAMRVTGGRVNNLGGDDVVIPYKELFQMGGQSTVRGFLWGGVGPAWNPTGSPLGARNAVSFRTELIFPLIPDYSMKGHVFYDAGSGWSTPTNDLYGKDCKKANANLIMANVTRNKFDLRHSIGFGVNMVNPFPATIDWGFKLDRKRHLGESAYEFHLGMNYAW